MKKERSSKRSHQPTDINDTNIKSIVDVESKGHDDIDSKKKKPKISLCSVTTAATPTPNVTDKASNEVIEQAWGHYRAYLESEEEGEEGEPADIDELHEVLHILEGCVNFGSDDDVDDKSISIDISSLPEFHLSVDINTFTTQKSLLPALLSMTHLHIGNYLISQGFENQAEMNSGDANNNDDPLIHLYKSLRYFPFNASALSILANYKRMNKKDAQQTICDFYERASDNAKLLRDLGISILNHGNEHYKDDINMYKEWTELLFLDGMCGVEYIGEEDDEDGDEDDDGEDDGEDDEEVGEVGDDAMNSESENKCDEDTKEANNGDSNDEYSISDVESVASFMSALLNSTLGNHDKAISHLKKFNLTHRIHPNVWSFSMDKLKHNAIKKSKESIQLDNRMTFAPKIFRGSVLPQHLYKRMCNTFQAGSAYWKQSSYQNRGYYSFFNDVNDNMIANPNNLIEDVVINHLLPIVRQEMPKEARNIVGFEWWTHTRPLSANLGHQLHFDTDEALLDQKKEVTHPIVSSVLYLTGNKENDEIRAGSTIVFNQSPDSKTVASKAYISHAHDNSYMIFPGNCLHGVLPCPGRSKNKMEENESVERLTFMVGFWTRRVPDHIKEEKLYSPCGPMPPKSDDHSWVEEISSDYGNKMQASQCSPSSRKLEGTILPAVEPAWEKIETESGTRSLGIPCTLDHRFFVHGAPNCFRDSLFKSDETF